jgi:hypothetical protein
LKLKKYLTIGRVSVLRTGVTMFNFDKPWELGQLRVNDSGRYLMNGEEPFFWMGDTAWLLFQKLTLEETTRYLKNRKEKGFNIILVDFLHSAGSCNMAGSTALLEEDFARPNLNGDYWIQVDQVIRVAQDLGLYMGILPAWGSSVLKQSLNLNNVDAYTEFITARYGAYPNIVWILGGDVRGDVNEPVVDRMGCKLKEQNPDKLVAYHPFGRTSSSLWYHEKEWLDFNMFQSGHRRYDQASLGAWDDNAVKEDYYGEDVWRYVQRDYARSPKKPTVDGEPSYEHILQGLHDETQPYWQVCDVRRYAYWSVFAGALGHTYGDNSIMQFFRKEEKKGAFGVKDDWEVGLHHPGSSQMTHLHRLMKSIRFTEGKASQDLLEGGQGEKYDYISVFSGEDFVLCYNYSGRPFSIKLEQYEGSALEVFWFDPESGVASFAEERKGGGTFTAVPPRKDKDSDYVLIIKKKAGNYAAI